VNAIDSPLQHETLRFLVLAAICTLTQLIKYMYIQLIVCLITVCGPFEELTTLEWRPGIGTIIMLVAFVVEVNSQSVL